MIASLLALSVSIVQIGAAAPTPQATAAFERGERALASNQLEDAERAYREAITASPDYAAAINGLGSVLFKQGKRNEAIEQFRAAIKADPKFALAYFNLGYAARKIGDFASAAEAYETYTKLKPEDPDGFYGLGESYRQLGDNPKAIAAYEQYIRREKRPSEQKWVDRAKETIATLKAGAQAAPPAASAQPVATAAPAQATPPQAGAAAGPVASAPAAQPGAVQGAVDAPGAPAAPQTGGTAQPELAKKRIAEGDQFMREKKFREASFAYQDAVNADGTNIEALFKLGNSFAVLGYYAQAIERWNRVIELTGDPAVKKSAQDNISRAQAKMAQAGGSTPQAAGVAPGTAPVAASTRQQARAAYEEGVRLINARDYDGAVQQLTIAIQLEPSLAVAYVARGSAFIGLKRFTEAAADYQYANRLDPNLSSPLYGMAEAYRALGRNADARNYYEQYAQSKASDVRPELQAQARQKAAQLR